MLSGDVTRFKDMMKRIDDLTLDDFNKTDQDNLLKQASNFLPMVETKEVHPETGKVTLYSKPDYDSLPGKDEISLLKFLKQHKAFS